MTEYVKDGGLWKPVNSKFIKSSGVYRECTSNYVKDGGVWKNSFRKRYRYLRIFVTDTWGAMAAFYNVSYSEDGGITKIPSSYMTAANTPSPLVATASSTFSAGYEPWRGFNGSTADTWTSTNGLHTNQWLRLDLGAGNYAAPNWVQYTVVNAAGYNKSPKGIIIELSNTGAFAGEQEAVFSVSGLSSVADKTVVTFTW